MKIHVVKINGQLEVIDDVKCSRAYCVECGCDFPKCATFTGEKFENEEKLRDKYPDIEIV